MTDIEKREIVKLVKVKIANENLTQNGVAKLMGFNAGTLSNLLNGVWENNPKIASDDIWNRMAKFCGYTPGWQCAETLNFIRIQNICEMAQQDRVSNPIAFYPGSGKTFALKYYKEHHGNVCYMQCRNYGKREFIVALSNAIGLNEMPLSVNSMIDMIVDSLNHTHALVIIDEAHLLKDAAFFTLHDLLNECEFESSFIIAGTIALKRRFEKGIKLEKASFNEILSRMGGQTIGLHKIDDAEIKKVCIANGVTEQKAITNICEYVRENTKGDAIGDLRQVREKIRRLRFANE